MRYCSCGYPIAVSIFWGLGLCARLSDGKGGKDSPLLDSCPRCGNHLDVRALLTAPPPISYMSDWTDSGQDAEEEDVG